MDINHARPLAYSIKDACAASSLGRTTLYSHINSGRLKAIRVGGRTIIPADSLISLLEGKEQGQ
jgi:excisionase family DNA binding protein